MSLRLEMNGQPRVFDALQPGDSLGKLIAEMGLKSDRIAVECNGEIVTKGSWDSNSLADGDRLEIVHFVGEGSSSAPLPGAYCLKSSAEKT